MAHLIELRRLTPEEVREAQRALRSHLTDRFGLKYHIEAKPGAAAYYLVVPQNDPAGITSEPHRLNAKVMVIDHMPESPTEN